MYPPRTGKYLCIYIYCFVFRHGIDSSNDIKIYVCIYKCRYNGLIFDFDSVDHILYLKC